MGPVFSRTWEAIPRAHYFFYTTRPRCARRYGKNDVVGVARVGPPGR